MTAHIRQTNDTGPALGESNRQIAERVAREKAEAEAKKPKPVIGQQTNIQHAITPQDMADMIVKDKKRAASRSAFGIEGAYKAFGVPVNLISE